MRKVSVWGLAAEGGALHPATLGNVNMTTAATSTSDLCYATATELARRIRDREISSAEVTEAFLVRIAAHNSKLNAIVHLLETEARSREGSGRSACTRPELGGSSRRPCDDQRVVLDRQYAGDPQLEAYEGFHRA